MGSQYLKLNTGVYSIPIVTHEFTISNLTHGFTVSQIKCMHSQYPKLNACVHSIPKLKTPVHSIPNQMHVFTVS